MSIGQLHGKIPFGAQFCSYLWTDNRTDHLNILQQHGLHIRELLNWLVFWLVNHTNYRNRIHPLETLKCWKLFFITRSIIASSRPSERRQLKHRTLVPILFGVIASTMDQVSDLALGIRRMSGPKQNITLNLGAEDINIQKIIKTWQL